mgnify:CR=1 FL=1
MNFYTVVCWFLVITNKKDLGVFPGNTILKSVRVIKYGGGWIPAKKGELVEY